MRIVLIFIALLTWCSVFGQFGDQNIIVDNAYVRKKISLRNDEISRWTDVVELSNVSDTASLVNFQEGDIVVVPDTLLIRDSLQWIVFVGGGLPITNGTLTTFGDSLGVDTTIIATISYVNQGDTSTTNELNTNLSLTGTTLGITDAGGTLSWDLDTTFLTETEFTSAGFGSGTPNYLTYWVTADSLGDSPVYVDGSNVVLGGTSAPQLLTLEEGHLYVYNASSGSFVVLNRGDGKATSLQAGQNKSSFFFDETGNFAIASNTKANIIAPSGAGTDILTVYPDLKFVLTPTDVVPTGVEGGFYAGDSGNRPEYYTGAAWEGLAFQSDLLENNTSAPRIPFWDGDSLEDSPITRTSTTAIQIENTSTSEGAAIVIEDYYNELTDDHGLSFYGAGNTGINLTGAPEMWLRDNRIIFDATLKIRSGGSVHMEDGAVGHSWEPDIGGSGGYTLNFMADGGTGSEWGYRVGKSNSSESTVHSSGLPWEVWKSAGGSFASSPPWLITELNYAPQKRFIGHAAFNVSSMPTVTDSIALTLGNQFPVLYGLKSTGGMWVTTGSSILQEVKLEGLSNDAVADSILTVVDGVVHSTPYESASTALANAGFGSLTPTYYPYAVTADSLADSHAYYDAGLNRTIVVGELGVINASNIYFYDAASGRLGLDAVNGLRIEPKSGGGTVSNSTIQVDRVTSTSGTDLELIPNGSASDIINTLASGTASYWRVRDNVGAEMLRMEHDPPAFFIGNTAIEATGEEGKLQWRSDLNRLTGYDGATWEQFAWVSDLITNNVSDTYVPHYASGTNSWENGTMTFSGNEYNIDNTGRSALSAQLSITGTEDPLLYVRTDNNAGARYVAVFGSPSIGTTWRMSGNTDAGYPAIVAAPTESSASGLNELDNYMGFDHKSFSDGGIAVAGMTRSLAQRNYIGLLGGGSTGGDINQSSGQKLTQSGVTGYLIVDDTLNSIATTTRPTYNFLGGEFGVDASTGMTQNSVGTPNAGPLLNLFGGRFYVNAPASVEADSRQVSYGVWTTAIGGGEHYGLWVNSGRSHLKDTLSLELLPNDATADSVLTVVDGVIHRALPVTDTHIGNQDKALTGTRNLDLNNFNLTVNDAATQVTLELASTTNTAKLIGGTTSILTLDATGATIDIPVADDLFIDTLETAEPASYTMLGWDRTNKKVTAVEQSGAFMTFADSSVTVVLTGGGTTDAITNATNNLYTNTSYGVFTAAGDSLTINCDCLVTIMFSFSFNGANISTYELKPILNGTAVANTGMERDMTGTSTGVGAFTYTYLATSGDVIKPGVEETAGTTDATFDASTISAIKH